MQPRFRKIAVFAGAAALATGVGVAVASQGGEDTGSRAAMTQGMPGQPGGGQVQGTVPGQGQAPDRRPEPGRRARRPARRRRPGGIDLETLAEELGVSTDELQDGAPGPAARAARPVAARTRS